MYLILIFNLSLGSSFSRNPAMRIRTGHDDKVRNSPRKYSEPPFPIHLKERSPVRPTEAPVATTSTMPMHAIPHTTATISIKKKDSFENDLLEIAALTGSPRHSFISTSTPRSSFDIPSVKDRANALGAALGHYHLDAGAEVPGM